MATESTEADADVEAAPLTGLAGIKAGTWPTFLSKAHITAPDGFNRWLAVPPSFLVQLSIGSVYVRWLNDHAGAGEC